MSASIDALIPELQGPARALESLAARAGVGPRITSTRRSRNEQSKLYRRFLAGGSAYPVAPPGSSAHEYGYAFDMVVIGASNQNDLGQVWESWGGVWGGRARDPIHFEYPGFASDIPQARTAAPSSDGIGSTIASAVDFVLGFAPGIGEVELIATIVALGFPRSAVLRFLKNPVHTAFYGAS